MHGPAEITVGSFNTSKQIIFVRLVDNLDEEFLVIFAIRLRILSHCVPSVLRTLSLALQRLGARSAFIIGSRKSVVGPRVGGVGIAADFPEAGVILWQEDDVFHPLRTFPG